MARYGIFFFIKVIYSKHNLFCKISSEAKWENMSFILDLIGLGLFSIALIMIPIYFFVIDMPDFDPDAAEMRMLEAYKG